MNLDDLRTMRSPAQIFGGSNRFVVTNGTFRGEPALFLEPIPDELAREPGTQEETPADQSRLTPGSIAIVLGHAGTTEVLAYFLHRAALDAGHPVPSTFQDRVVEVFDDICRDDPTDLDERACRLFEEATETVQAVGMTREAAHQLVDYTFDRPPGVPGQEVGGLMVSIAGLCGQVGLGLSMVECAETELARCATPEVRAKIRGKRSRRHGRGPLPGTTEADLVPDGLRELDEAEMPGGFN